MLAVPRLFNFTLAFILQLRKIAVKLQVGRNAPSYSIASTFRCPLGRNFACGLGWSGDLSPLSLRIW
jgi:hypothetical protein